MTTITIRGVSEQRTPGGVVRRAARLEIAIYTHSLIRIGVFVDGIASALTGEIEFAPHSAVEMAQALSGIRG